MASNFFPLFRNPDLEAQRQLAKAMNWEAAFVEFMKNFTSDPENMKHFDIAFNSERSIEDELERETSGDILTIAVSYLIMFFYITFSLGQVTKWRRFMVSVLLLQQFFAIVGSISLFFIISSPFFSS